MFNQPVEQLQAVSDPSGSSLLPASSTAPCPRPLPPPSILVPLLLAPPLVTTGMESSSPLPPLSRGDGPRRDNRKWFEWWLHSSSGEWVIALFCLYVSRLLITPLWTISHIPYLSPIYKQGQHWAASPERKAAILVHITLGIVMLASGVHQVQAAPPAGSTNRKRHRWVGRVYVLSGLGVIASLQPLVSTMGQGSSGSVNIVLVAMAVTTSFAWLACVALALWQIRHGRRESHARLMRCSLWMALTPLTQRLVHVVLEPATMIVQLLRGVQKWPGSGELIWSPDGYGRCSQAVLSASAWSGLLINAAFAIRSQYFSGPGTRKTGANGGAYEAVNSEDCETQGLGIRDEHFLTSIPDSEANGLDQLWG